MRALHPNLVPWFAEFNATAARLLAEGFKQTPVNVREGFAAMIRAHVTQIPTVAWIQDDYVATPDYDVPARIYHPAPDRALPVLIYYHGGGHASGSVTSYDPICRKIALATEHIVVAPEYRLAPECRYQDGVTDACNVAKYLWRTLDDRKLRHRRELSLAGDSAGGSLAAIVSSRAQYDAGLDIKRQALLYPWLDYTMSTPGVDENGVGYTLPKVKSIWFCDTCFPQGENRKDLSPMFWEATDKLPETLVITAEFCPLRDEGVYYADKVRAAGVRTEHLHFPDMPHTFICLEDVAPEACARLYAALGTFLRG